MWFRKPLPAWSRRASAATSTTSTRRRCKRLRHWAAAETSITRTPRSHRSPAWWSEPAVRAGTRPLSFAATIRGSRASSTTVSRSTVRSTTTRARRRPTWACKSCRCTRAAVRPASRLPEPRASLTKSSRLVRIPGTVRFRAAWLRSARSTTRRVPKWAAHRRTVTSAITSA